VARTVNEFEQVSLNKIRAYTRMSLCNRLQSCDRKGVSFVSLDEIRFEKILPTIRRRSTDEEAAPSKPPVARVEL